MSCGMYWLLVNYNIYLPESRGDIAFNTGVVTSQYADAAEAGGGNDGTEKIHKPYLE